MTLRVEWYGPQVKRAVRAAAARGLLKGAEHVLEEADRIVPHEEGTLERSGVASVDDQALRAAVGYDTPYAVRQHEELDYHHDSGRQAKYLESPLNGPPGKHAFQLVAAEIKKEIGAA